MSGNNTVDMISKELEGKQSDLVLDSLGKYFKEESMRQCEEWFADSASVEVPETLDFKLRQITQKYEKAHQDAAKRAKRKKYLRVGGLILAAVICAGGVTFVTSDAWRDSVNNVLFNPGDGNVDVEFKESNANVVIPEDLDVILYPDYLPRGYVLAEVVSEGPYVWLVFIENETYDEINIMYLEQSRTLSLDKDKSNNEMVLVNGEEAIWQNRESMYNLVFQLNNYRVELSCNSCDIEKERIIQIAESIRAYSSDEFDILL